MRNFFFKKKSKQREVVIPLPCCRHEAAWKAAAFQPNASGVSCIKRVWPANTRGNAGGCVLACRAQVPARAARSLLDVDGRRPISRFKVKFSNFFLLQVPINKFFPFCSNRTMCSGGIFFSFLMLRLFIFNIKIGSN